MVLVPQATRNAADEDGCPAPKECESGWGIAAHLTSTQLLQDTSSGCVLCTCHMGRYDPMKQVNIYVAWYYRADDQIVCAKSVSSLAL